MAASTASIRFPAYTHSNFSSIVASVVPVRQCHYLLTGYTPFTSDNVERAKLLKKTTVHDVMRRLLQSKNIMASLSPSRQSCFISAFNLIRGTVDPAEVLKYFFSAKFSDNLDSQKSHEGPRKEAC